MTHEMAHEMTHAFTLALLRAALFTSIAIVLLLVLRKGLRRRLGVAAAYQAWLVVPCATLAAVLPIRQVPLLEAAPNMRAVSLLAVQAVPQAPARIDALLLAWAVGVLACALWFIAGHRAFLRQAGRLSRSGDVYVGTGDAGPACVGLLRPKIIVPHDFRQRYSPLEQALVIAHERVHAERGDALANLAAAAFQCVFWFNPLCHLGVRSFRQDQEIACDGAVMRQHPRRQRAYAEALLKSHVAAAPIQPGINCYTQSHQPIKERLMSLQLHPPGTVRRIAGRCVLALLAAGALVGTFGARAEQAKAAPTFSVRMALEAEGVKAAPRIVTKAGEEFAVASGEWRLEMTLREGEKAGQVWLAGRVLKGSEVVASPTLLTHFNEEAGIKITDHGAPFAVSLTVTPQP